MCGPTWGVQDYTTFSGAKIFYGKSLEGGDGREKGLLLLLTRDSRYRGKPVDALNGVGSPMAKSSIIAFNIEDCWGGVGFVVHRLLRCGPSKLTSFGLKGITAILLGRSGKHLHIAVASDWIAGTEEAEEREKGVSSRLSNRIIHHDGINHSGLGDANRIAGSVLIPIACWPSISSGTRKLIKISGGGGWVSHTVPLLIFNQSVHVQYTTRCEGDHMITFFMRLMATLGNSEGGVSSRPLLGGNK